MKRIRDLATCAWAGMGATIIYVIFLVTTKSPRIEDGNLTMGEMNIIEGSIFLFSWVTMFIFWFYTVYKAYRSRRFGWLAFSAFLWPLYPIYLWRFAHESESV